MKATAIIFAAMMLISNVSVAEDVSYTHVRLNYVNTELDIGPVDVDGDGLELKGSWAATNNVFVFGDYSDVDFDFDVDASRLELGGGYRYAVRPRIDLVGRAGYSRIDLSTSGVDADDDGLLFSGGVRSRMTDRIEGRAALNYRMMDESDNNTEFEFGGDFFVTQNVSLGAALCLGDDATTWSFGGRYAFQ
ncbi:MAG: outer membrane beta-barrel protein [Gammaproteobacteria bacterium]